MASGILDNSMIQSPSSPNDIGEGRYSESKVGRFSSIKSK